MMHQRKTILILIILLLFAAGCTSTNTQDEESMINMDQEVADAAEGDGSIEGDPELEAGDEVAALDESEEAIDPSAQASNDSKGEDDFEMDTEEFAAEEFQDNTVAEQEPAAPSVAEDEALEPLEPEVATQDSVPEPVPESTPAFQEPMSPPPIIPPVAETAAPVSEPRANITDIRYQSTPQGGRIIIVGDRALNYQTRLNPDTNQFIIEVPGARLPNKLKRPFLMKEFPEAAFGAINAYQKDGNATPRIVIQLKHQGMAEPLVEATGRSVTVAANTEVNGSSSLAMQSNSADSGLSAKSSSSDGSSPSYEETAIPNEQKTLGARTLEEFLMTNNRFYGRPLSIQLKDADIRDVLNFIADESGANLVISDDVTGQVSIKLRQVPWDQALVTIMRAKRLGYVRNGSVLRISKVETLQQEAEATKRMMDTQRVLSPLKVKVIPVNFANVEDLVTQFTPFMSKDRNGSVIADKRTGSLIVTDDEEVIDRVSKLVKELDVPPAQVLIEGKIVEARETFERRVGFNWSLSGSNIDLGSGSQGQINLRPRVGVESYNSNEVPVFQGGFNVGTLDVIGNLSAVLALAEQDAVAKVISSPRVVTMNKEAATIRQEGEQVTISTIRDPTGTTQRGVQRVPVVVELKVTPQVSDDASVILDVDVHREFVGALLDAESQAREINRRSAKTKILLKNGQTGVIGGIYQSDMTKTDRGVPGLKNIPVLGWLFKGRNRDESKNELLIFLTPRILSQRNEPPSA